MRLITDLRCSTFPMTSTFLRLCSLQRWFRSAWLAVISCLQRSWALDPNLLHVFILHTSDRAGTFAIHRVWSEIVSNGSSALHAWSISIFGINLCVRAESQLFCQACIDALRSLRLFSCVVVSICFAESVCMYVFFSFFFEKEKTIYFFGGCFYLFFLCLSGANRLSIIMDKNTGRDN